MFWCLFGHDWEIFEEVDIPSSEGDVPYTEWCVGGLDYKLRCVKCGKEGLVEKRGAWIGLDYPRSVDFKRTKGVSDSEYC